MSQLKSPTTRLDVDESILSRTLKLDQEEDEFEKLLNAALSEREAPSAAGGGAPYRVVKPKPSFCVKTRNVITSEKVFLNVCRTDALPEPVDVSEEQLTRILESDEPSTFRVPMSLGEGHQETDKSGAACTAYDVAVHDAFVAKCESSLLFQTFLVTAAMEGLEDKHGMELDKNGWTVLKNRKSLGGVRSHRIEQRPAAASAAAAVAPPPARPLIEEVDAAAAADGGPAPPPVARLAVARSSEGVAFVLATVALRTGCSLDDVALSVAPHRLTVRRRRRPDADAVCDVRLLRRVDPRRAAAVLNRANRVLTVVLPLL